MSDFRTDLYHRYVSTFKTDEQREVDYRALHAYWDYCQRKYLPLLQAVPRDGAVLDLGCGAGYLLRFLMMQGFSQVEGVDVSAEQVQLATKRGCRAGVVDAFRFLESRRQTFDAIIALDFVEHFTKEEVVRMLTSICDALKEGGVLLLQTPNGQGLFATEVIYGDFTHMTIFNPGSLAQLLRAAGFAEIRFTETGPVASNWMGLSRLMGWRLIRGAANFVRAVETGKRQEVWTENLICHCQKQLG